jgi:hypothetical protein
MCSDVERVGEQEKSLCEAFIRWRVERVSVNRVETQPTLDHQEPLHQDFYGAGRVVTRLSRCLASRSAELNR